ncbi:MULTISPECIES: hypothetical protein [unclassified Exiguobacterium]|nr:MULTISPECIES: hypothetical protein [unclassified Exiguobacterium]
MNVENTSVLIIGGVPGMTLAVSMSHLRSTRVLHSNRLLTMP